MSIAGAPPPRRVRVTSPRVTAPRRGPARSLRVEVDETTALGQVYLDALIRAQRRLAAMVLGATIAVVGAFLALFLLVPAAQELRVGPVPLVWLLLGGLAYAYLLAVGAAYLRAVERLEAEFDHLLRRE